MSRWKNFLARYIASVCSTEPAWLAYIRAGTPPSWAGLVELYDPMYLGKKIFHQLIWPQELVARLPSKYEDVWKGLTNTHVLVQHCIIVWLKKEKLFVIFLYQTATLVLLIRWVMCCWCWFELEVNLMEIYVDADCTNSNEHWSPSFCAMMYRQADKIADSE